MLTKRSEYLDMNAGQASNDKLCKELFEAGHWPEVERILYEYETGAGSEFLCFSHPYELLAQLIPLHKVVIDFGCCNAFQGWWFRKHKAYIGVDPSTQIAGRMYLPNMKHLLCTAQDADLSDFEGPFFAICNAVPGYDVKKYVKTTFEHCYVNYPG